LRHTARGQFGGIIGGLQVSFLGRNGIGGLEEGGVGALIVGLGAVGQGVIRCVGRAVYSMG
jgi:hypothetical protein